VLARGITKARGTLGNTPPGRDGPSSLTRFELRERVGGHSLLAVESVAEPRAILRALARLGHPVLGDARHGDGRSNAHFEHRHGLDRAFLHLTSLDLRYGEREVSLRSPLAPDLSRVLASLRAAAPAD